MRRQPRILAAAASVLFACLFLASLLIPSIKAERRALELDIAPPENLPPEIALATVVSGAFRGILVDLLWERHDLLQQQGQFFEAVQLGRWITALQPKFDRVWSFMAWNLAFNISAATHTPKERWSWIQEGIGLLRDEGIPLNPRSRRLHRELGFLILQKISGLHDNFHPYYKNHFAREWEVILGTPPLETSARVEAFRPVAEAPVTTAAFIAAHPQLEPRLDELAEGFGLRVDGQLLWELRRAYLDRQHPLLPWLQRLNGSERDALKSFLRGRVIREHFHMDPRLMLDLMEHVGPLDWRHSASHGLYWLAQGVLRHETGRTEVRLERQRVLDDGQVVDDLDSLFGYPFVTGALRDLWDGGDVRHDTSTRTYSFRPDRRFLEPFIASKVDDAFLRKLLEDALYLAYFTARDDDAAVYLAELRQRFGDDPRGRLYRGETAEFVQGYLVDLAPDLGSLRQQLAAMLSMGLTLGVAEGRPEVHRRFREQARRLHEEAESEYGESLERFADLEFRGWVEVLKLYPGLAPLESKRRVWAAVPEAQRRAVYAEVGDQLRSEALRLDEDPDVLFPRPE